MKKKTDDFDLKIVDEMVKDGKYENNIELDAVCQNAKDQACMSDKSYKEFRKKIKPAADIASLARCVEYKKKVDQFWHIQTNEKGAFIADPLSKIKFVCTKYLSLLENPQSTHTFNILLSGDGFSLTKTHTNAFNFTFSLMNDGDLSYRGFYILGCFFNLYSIKNLIYIKFFKILIEGIFKILKEDYENIKISLNELIMQLSGVKDITINDVTYGIEFYLGGDLKWLSTVQGISTANSNYPCPWCTWKSTPIKWTEKEINQKWPNNERDHQIAKVLCKEKVVEKKKGYINESLFSFIPFAKSVVDPLHLFLRITDKLMDMLLFRLKELDIKEKSFKLGDISTRNITLNFLEYLKEEKTGCNLTSPYFIADKEFKLRSFNSNEKKKIIEKISSNHFLNIFSKQIQEDRILNEIIEAFKDFKMINELLKINYFEFFKKTEIELKIKSWLRKMIKLEPDITPYTHILGFHVVEFIEKYKDLKLFSMQGLEKLNHMTKISYLKQTMHHKDFTLCLLKKMNRLEFIHLQGSISDLNKKNHIV